MHFNSDYYLYCFVIITTLFLIKCVFDYFRYSRSYKCFKVNPIFYKLIAGDAVNSKKGTLWHNFSTYTLAGRPDALFRHRIFFWYFILGELKSRQIRNNPPRVYDYVEVILDAGLVKKNYYFASVKIILKYKDKTKIIKFSRKNFQRLVNFMVRFSRCKSSNNLASIKHEAIELNHLIQKFIF
jgi:hypothetical protein